ncbi:MFS transporter [Sphingobium sp. SA2]|uniref:MFS transporter n=1 Tax=Sphingobium sp. SA2 TaxID=1524832 RepID=UPI0028C2FF67|nr:MFS transporter [Sphingobium sp. SA2]MDT7535452.1 MFS transporter [Sphingobium sp. SA2]
MKDRVVVASEWKANWTFVLAASFGFSFFSIMLAATGIFMEPLAAEFGWKRTVLSVGPSIATTITAILSPFFGALIDRHGSRRLVLPGLLLTMSSIASFSLATGSTTQWIILWVIFGLVAVSIKSTAWTAAILGRFRESRGLALGLTLAGTAVAQAIVPPLANWLIANNGWRGAYILLALGWGGITFLMCLRFFFDAHDRRSMSPSQDTPSPASLDVKLGLSTPAALADSALWRVAISNFVVMALTMGLTIHLFPILTEAGVSRTKAAWLLSLAGIAGIIGKLATGALLDRLRPNWIGGITLGVASLAFLLLDYGPRSPVLIVFAMLVNGYAAGTKTQITGFLTATYGGMRNFGKIYGVMAALMALASGVGPLLAGYIYDISGGYSPFLLIGALGCAAGGLLMISLPVYPSWDNRTATA